MNQADKISQPTELDRLPPHQNVQNFTLNNIHTFVISYYFPNTLFFSPIFGLRSPIPLPMEQKIIFLDDQTRNFPLYVPWNFCLYIPIRLDAMDE